MIGEESVNDLDLVSNARWPPAGEEKLREIEPKRVCRSIEQIIQVHEISWPCFPQVRAQWKFTTIMARSVKLFHKRIGSSLELIAKFRGGQNKMEEGGSDRYIE